MVAPINQKVKQSLLPLRAGPQPANQVAGTFASQIARAIQGRPRHSVAGRVQILERQLADLRRQFARAGVPL